MTDVIANVKVEPVKVLFGATDLGLTEMADIDPKFGELLKAVEAHQHGKNKIGDLRIGKKPELALVLKESSVSQLTTLLGLAGETPTAVAEVTTVATVADVSGSKNNKYFYINSGKDAVKYYVWLNVNSAGTDPALSGYTGIEVAAITSATADAIASAIQAAVAAITASFTATVSGHTVTITNVTAGGTTDAADSATGTATGFTIATTVQGFDASPGWGTNKDFISTAAVCRSLTLHPVALADTDQSRDLHFWKVYPMLEGFKFSGDKEMLVPLKFEIYPDFTKDAKVNYFVYGAHL